MADEVRHGLDNDPDHDPETGAVLGGLGGAVVGAAAGYLMGPAGAVLGAVAGGLLGAGSSGAAVAVVDAVDDDDSLTGIGPPTEHVHQDEEPAMAGEPRTGASVQQAQRPEDPISPGFDLGRNPVLEKLPDDDLSGAGTPEAGIGPDTNSPNLPDESA